MGLAGLLLLAGSALRAEDWARWRGPRMDGVSLEKGLIRTWPAEGPKVAWKRELTGGYSAVVVSRGRLITHVRDGADEVLWCLDANTGEPAWQHRYPVDYDAHPTLDQRFKSGPRATPLVEGDLVYSIGTTGVVSCVEFQTGKPLWSLNLMEFAGRACPEFGYCNSPIIEGNRLFLHPGGKNGRSLAAVDPRTGRVLWTALDDAIGYSTPYLLSVGEQRQLIHFTAEGLVAVAPDSGRVLWRYAWKTNFDLNCATPIHFDGHVFLSSNYGRGCALIRLQPGGEPVEVYRSQQMTNHFSTSIYYQGHLYGFDTNRLRCLNAMTGEVRWEQRGLGRGALTLADGKLIVLGEQGDLVLATAAPEKYEETARWKALQGICWSAPVLANGRLYLRNEKSMLAVDLRERP